MNEQLKQLDEIREPLDYLDEQMIGWDRPIPPPVLQMAFNNYRKDTSRLEKALRAAYASLYGIKMTTHWMGASKMAHEGLEQIQKILEDKA